jgi:hypothetical protein
MIMTDIEFQVNRQAMDKAARGILMSSDALDLLQRITDADLATVLQNISGYATSIKVTELEFVFATDPRRPGTDSFSLLGVFCNPAAGTRYVSWERQQSPDVRFRILRVSGNRFASYTAYESVNEAKAESVD